MFVFENHYDLQVQPAKFKAEIFELLNYYQEEIKNEAERPPTHVKPLLFDNLHLHLHYEEIYYGLIAPEKLSEDKAQRLLQDLKEEVRKLYKGNVSYMKRQTNLENNCMSKFMKSKVDVIIENYTSVTSTQNLDNAFKKVQAVKDMAGDIIEEQVKNMEQAEKLMQTTQDIKWEAKDYEKGSKTLENIMKRQEFWMCSRRCILMFLCLGLIIGIIIIVISSAGGSDDSAEENIASNSTTTNTTEPATDIIIPSQT